MLNSFAPPFKIVCGYFILGFLFLIFLPFVLFRHDFSDILSLPSVALVHLFLLGFVLNIIIGSLYQLTSVVLESKFGIIKFANFNQILFGIGVFGICFSFASANLTQIAVFGGILFLSLGYFCTGFLLSFRGVKDFNFAKFTLLLAGIFLALGLVFGFVLTLILSGNFAINLNFDLAFKFHIYFMLGSLYFIILASSCVLLPMFALSHNLKFIVTKFGVFFYILGGIFINFYGVFAVLAVVCFCVQALFILFKRARKSYDYWNLNIFWAIFCLIFACFFAIFGEFKFLMILLGFGFFYPFIVAHAYKILAFLVWYHYISPFAGKIKVPLLHEMVSSKIAYFAFLLNIFGVIFAFLNLQIPSFLALEFSVILFLINIFNILKFVKFKGNL